MSGASTTATAAQTKPTPATRARILEAAVIAFSARGFEATSLDGLAAGLGIRKQTILHHFGSKDLLLDAVLQATVEEFAEAVDSALTRQGTPWARLDAVVRAIFAHARRRPHTMGFLRELGRLGPRSVDRLNAALEPLTRRATAFIKAEMVDGRRREPRLVVLSAYASVIGAATEVEVLRSLGVEPSARLLVRRRRELLVYLAAMLGVDAPEVEPADTEPADTEPADTEPADNEPADNEPADNEPAEGSG